MWDETDIRNHRWDRVGGGDGFDTRPDPQDSMIGYSMSQGGELVRWNLEELPAVTDPEAALRPDSPIVHDRFQTNLIGVLNACRAVLPQMIERRNGKINQFVTRTIASAMGSRKSARTS